jgi:hypothetical protein
MTDSTRMASLVQASRSHIGCSSIIRIHSASHGDAVVVEAEAADSTHYFLTSYDAWSHSRAEREAHSVLGPAIPGSLPTLVGCDGGSKLLVLSALPGVRADSADPSVEQLVSHKRVGELLRRITTRFPPTRLSRLDSLRHIRCPARARR